jgi:hypothetical protein
MCRQSTGGAYVTWATVPKSSFTWTGDAPAEFHSSPHGTRYFCPACGAQLALFVEASPTTIDVTVATFTNPEQYPPVRDIWFKRKLPWTPRDPRLPGEDEENGLQF